MQALTRPGGVLQIRAEGPADAPALILANSLGTDLRLWDAMMPHLRGYRIIRYDKQGHGLSELRDGTRLADHAEDAAAVADWAGGPVTVLGCSIGGLIGLRLAATRPDLVRALILSNTAARMGTPEGWRARIEAVRAGGTGAIADAVMERWFAPAFRATPELALWRTMLARTCARGYAAACQALAEADETRAAAALRLPVMVVAGGRDGAAPPEEVRATAALIPGARFHLIPEAGHLPCVETPGALASAILPFLEAHA